MREAFKTLLKDWGKNEGLLFIPEYEHKTAMVERRYIDGALVEPQLRLPVGYWEAKDTNDDLDAEIAKKFRRGYPQDNIIFEDSETAVLFQNKREVLRCSVDDPEKIKRLVDQFFKFEPEVIREFRKAVEQFREDLPAVLETLRKAIDKAENENTAFKKAAIKFLKHAKDTINTSVTAADVREMLIQHILTEEIFSQVFDNTDFHHNNNVAKELYNLEATFFTGGVKRETIERLRPYYSAITPTLDRSDPSLFERRVAQIVDHSFNNSQLFSLAKWVLILSLAVLGVGSLSYGGLSLKLWSQAGEATQKLQEISDKHEQINHEIEQKQEALVEAQDETIREVKRVIEEKARGWDNELSSLVDKSKQEVLEKLATANTFIEDQKSKVLTSVAGGDAFIESQKGKIVRDISDVSIVIEGQKGKISSDLVTAIDYFEAEKKGFAKILNTASTSLEEQKRKFATDLALLLEETNGKVDPAVKERLLVVAKAAENGAQTIEDESRRKVEVIGRKADTEAASIHQAAEGKKSDLDLVT